MFAKTNLSEHFFYLLFQSLLIFHQLAVAALLYVLITKASCLVNLIIRVATLEEEHLAIALKGKDVRTDTVKEPTVVADHNSTAGKALKTLLVLTSMSLVGSSSNSTLPSCFRARASCKRLRSPPDRVPQSLLWSVPAKLKREM